MSVSKKDLEKKSPHPHVVTVTMSDSENAMVEILAKEAENIRNNISTFRLKGAFAVWLGPFVILSSVIIATDGKFESPSWQVAYLPYTGALLSYLLLGFIGGCIERGAWRRCNAIHARIVELTGEPLRKPPKSKLFWIFPIENPKHPLLDPKIEQMIVWMYVLVFLVVGWAFVSVAYLATSRNEKGPAEIKPIHQINAAADEPVLLLQSNNESGGNEPPTDAKQILGPGRSVPVISKATTVASACDNIC